MKILITIKGWVDVSDNNAIEKLQNAFEETLKRIATETGNTIAIERLEEFKNFRLSLIEESGLDWPATPTSLN